LTAADDAFTFTLRTGTTGARWELPLLNNDSGRGIYIISAFSTSPNFQGTISVPANGQSVVYRLGQRYNGVAFTDTFTYVVRDSAGGSARATVDVTVSPGELQSLLNSASSWTAAGALRDDNFGANDALLSN
jgi:hypothetical protein